jgi:hypothetical protein
MPKKRERPIEKPVREKCTFFANYLDSVYELETIEEQTAALFALLEYMVFDMVPQDLRGGAAILFKMAKPYIDNSILLSEKRRASGSKGGKANAKQNEANAKQNEANAKQRESEQRTRNIEQRTKNKEQEQRTDLFYDQFCKVYPKQERLPDAFESFEKLIDEGETPKRLIGAAKEYARECKEARTENRYISYAHNFLSNGKYKAYADKVEARENRYKPIEKNPFDRFVGHDNPFNDSLSGDESHFTAPDTKKGNEQ